MRIFRRCPAWIASIVLMATAFAPAAHAQQTPAAAPPSEPATTALKVLTWNIYGAVRGGRNLPLGCQEVFEKPLEWWDEDLAQTPQCPALNVDTDGLAFLDVLADRIADQEPQLVGLQEVCGSQALGLERRLRERGYPMQVFFDRGLEGESRCPAPEAENRLTEVPAPAGLENATPLGAFGKVVAARADTAAMPDFDTNARDGVSQSGGPVVDTCLRYQIGPEVQFCSIHTAPERVGDVASVLNFVLADEGPTIAVGDFNAQPQDEVMDAMYYAGPEDDYQGLGQFYEASQPCANPGIVNCLGEPGRSRRPVGGTHSEGKIDLIFADQAHFNHTLAESWHETPQCGVLLCSDHDMVWAQLHLRTGPQQPTVPVANETGPTPEPQGTPGCRLPADEEIFDMWNSGPPVSENDLIVLQVNSKVCVEDYLVVKMTVTNRRPDASAGPQIFYAQDWELNSLNWGIGPPQLVCGPVATAQNDVPANVFAAMCS
jgi:endonuclease/exonuclease/phosphatase family metal-dependent hydrolase